MKPVITLAWAFQNLCAKSLKHGQAHNSGYDVTLTGPTCRKQKDGHWAHIEVEERASGLGGQEEASLEEFGLNIAARFHPILFSFANANDHLSCKDT